MQRQSSAIECEVCGSTSFSESDVGTLVCNDCGTSSTQYQMEATDMSMPGVVMHGVRSSQQLERHSQADPVAEVPPSSATTLPPPPRTKVRYSLSEDECICRVLAFTLREQTEWLVSEKSVHHTLVDATFRLFKYWLRRSKARQRRRLRLIATAGMCYLALVHIRESILPTVRASVLAFLLILCPHPWVKECLSRSPETFSPLPLSVDAQDLEWWIQELAFPYMSVGRRLSKALLQHRQVRQMINVYKLPTARDIRSSAQQLASLVDGVAHLYSPSSAGLGFTLPVGNPVLVLERYARALELDGGVFVAALKVRAQRLAATRTLASRCSDHSAKRHYMRTRAAPYVLCTELELMADILIAAHLCEVYNTTLPKPVASYPGDLDLPPLNELSGARLKRFIEWCDKLFVERGSREKSSAALEIASLTRDLGEHLRDLTALQGLEIDTNKDDHDRRTTLPSAALALMRLNPERTGGVNEVEQVRTTIACTIELLLLLNEASSEAAVVGGTTSVGVGVERSTE